MRFLILAGSLVVFISVIFMLFVLTDMSDKYLDCNPIGEDTMICNLKELGMPFVISLSILGSFVLVDCIVVYLLVKVLRIKGSFGYNA